MAAHLSATFIPAITLAIITILTSLSKHIPCFIDYAVLHQAEQHSLFIINVHKFLARDLA